MNIKHWTRFSLIAICCDVVTCIARNCPYVYESLLFVGLLVLFRMCSTTGARDPLTSALHIILGDSMPLDIVRVTGWKSQCDDTATSEVPEVRYAASFAG